MGGQGAPPRILLDALNTRRYGAPYPTGWKAWPAGYIERMNQALNVYEACRAYANTPPIERGKLLEKNPHILEIVGELMVGANDS